MNDSGLSRSPVSSVPVCRQFWLAGNYEEALPLKSTLQSGGTYLHIHPKFLHSNATSHKWVFGAIAELLDNAIDEVQNGATYVNVDKIKNPRDGSPALLIQDNGGGMDPEAMRRCLSFGFSDKKLESTIGQYGNGFKTSSMRLGADVILFSRHLKGRKLTQSVGLLSYTFLKETRHDRIVVPIVDYEFSEATGSFKTIERHGREHFMSNLEMLLKWSPYATEAELSEQFNDIGYQGTKILIYNLWLNDEGGLELDFDSDPEDIRICSSSKNQKNVDPQAAKTEHLAHRLHYSLRAYLSILYLRIPGDFTIILRDRVVEWYHIPGDIKFPEFILYKPHSSGFSEGILTTIGFLKEAPLVNVHGFNVYHKNRLILPFWHVVSYDRNRGRGVIGVLEANFIKPAHNKQDFERTPLFQKLEQRLRDMTWEYWDNHCELIGYRSKKRTRAPKPSLGSIDGNPANISAPTRAYLQPQPDVSSYCMETNEGMSIPNSSGTSPEGMQTKRKECQHLNEPDNIKRRVESDSVIDTVFNQRNQSNQLQDPLTSKLIQENKRLRAKILEHDNKAKELNLKVLQLQREVDDAEDSYARLFAELSLLDEAIEEENELSLLDEAIEEENETKVVAVCY